MKNKEIIVVGGTGSWARGLIKELLSRNVKNVKVFARNEFRMISLMQELQSSKVRPVIGDIRDKSALLKASRGCDIAFHLAALKHVPVCENLPLEAIETNVMGTQNMIDCAVENCLEKVVYVSTDKAVNANCSYGCTKLLGEKLILAANNSQCRTKFMIFRGGNLLGSTGSVIPVFKEQIKEMGKVTLTDERMCRFFISVERASRLLAEVALKGAGGEIFLPAMPSVYIKDIAAYLLKKQGLSQENIQIVGVRPGEKIYEEMLAETEKNRVYRLDENLYLVVNEDTHGWISNGLVEKCSDYLHSSVMAALQKNQAEKFLAEVGE